MNTPICNEKFYLSWRERDSDYVTDALGSLKNIFIGKCMDLSRIYLLEEQTEKYDSYEEEA